MKPNKIGEKQVLEFIERLDWKGLSKAYQESQEAWNAENWRNFVEEIKREGRKEVLREVWEGWENIIVFGQPRSIARRLIKFDKFLDKLKQK